MASAARSRVLIAASSLFLPVRQVVTAAALSYPVVGSRHAVSTRTAALSPLVVDTLASSRKMHSVSVIPVALSPAVQHFLRSTPNAVKIHETGMKMLPLAVTPLMATPAGSWVAYARNPVIPRGFFSSATTRSTSSPLPGLAATLHTAALRIPRPLPHLPSTLRTAATSSAQALSSAWGRASHAFHTSPLPRLPATLQAAVLRIPRPLPHLPTTLRAAATSGAQVLSAAWDRAARAVHSSAGAWAEDKRTGDGGAGGGQTRMGQLERSGDGSLTAEGKGKEVTTFPSGPGLGGVPTYWGIQSEKLKREDGSEWPWHCFKPQDAYRSDQTIDLTKHHVPENLGDKVALRIVKLLRIPTDLLFQKRYGCRAMMLETVAAVPGMVGGMLLHLQSLRRFEHTGGWIKALLEEAENERMHLMTFIEVSKPKWWERWMVLATQGVFFNVYFAVYLASPRVAHRIVGYLEEEAIHSYTEFLKEIDAGRIENVPAPKIACDYWQLPADATLRDVVMVVRADEAHHRDVNHLASDIRKAKKQLKDVPAPVGYH